jgi:hypothetical protein
MVGHCYELVLVEACGLGRNIVSVAKTITVTIGESWRAKLILSKHDNMAPIIGLVTEDNAKKFATFSKSQRITQ